jgi:hypothetical protein
LRESTEAEAEEEEKEKEKEKGRCWGRGRVAVMLSS